MGGYVDVDGRATWYDEVGSGETLVLLHGGLCTNDTWAGQLPVFAERFRVVAPERRAHGHTADVDGPLTYAAMADDTIGFLDQVIGAPAHLVGWSDGGIVALLVAISRPDLVRKLVVIGTNFETAGLAPGVEDSFAEMSPDGADVEMFRTAYQAYSPDGPEHWPVVLAKFTEMAAREPHIPVEEISMITARTLVLVGDDDLVSLEHTVQLYRAIANSELAVLPGASHAVPLEKPALLNQIVLDFLAHDPVATMMPIRRASDDEGQFV